jgi:hypothetical protein
LARFAAVVQRVAVNDSYRTGLTPASDELANEETPWHYVTVSPPTLPDARKTGLVSGDT